ncbi:MAG: aminopeptidase [Flavobacterium sp.]|nr:MAG: aminopeptidase [Flavobacterium sp.]
MKQLILIIFLFLSNMVFAQTEKEMVENTVSKNQIEGHIYFLTDDLLKGRETGTPENKIAASYLANTLRSYGVQPNPKTGTYYQVVTLKKTSPPKNVTLSINHKKYDDKVTVNAAKTDYMGEAVFLGYGLEEDYKGKNVKGKIIILNGGNTEDQSIRFAYGLRKDKEKIALENGVIGIIEFMKAPDNIWGFIEHNFNGDRLEVESKNEESKNETGIPYVWIQDKDGSLSTEVASIKKINTTLKMDDQSTEPVLSQNVIGIIEGSDPKLKNEYIIYSAHYDHVGIGTPDKTGDSIYNGARDNAIGTTTVLSMAQNLAKYPTKRSALFILFTGEEKGLLGSQFYVENPVLPLNQMVYCFNSDNGGYNDTSLATIIGLDRTTASKNIKDAVATFGLKAIEDPAPEQGLFDRSDNVHFAKKGIPAPTFSLGFTSFDGEVTKYYHQAGDEADTLDFDYLFKFFKAYVLSGRNIANDPKAPFWVADDKYEEIGKELYKQ